MARFPTPVANNIIYLPRTCHIIRWRLTRVSAPVPNTTTTGNCTLRFWCSVLLCLSRLCRQLFLSEVPLFPSKVWSEWPFLATLHGLESEAHRAASLTEAGHQEDANVVQVGGREYIKHDNTKIALSFSTSLAIISQPSVIHCQQACSVGIVGLVRRLGCRPPSPSSLFWCVTKHFQQHLAIVRYHVWG